MKKIYILAEEKGSGKSTSLYNLAVKYPGKVSGIVTPLNEGGRYFFLIENNEFIPLETDRAENALKVGRFYFRKEAFAKAADSLKFLPGGDKLIILDEIGPLELREEGFYSLLRTILRREEFKLLLAVRKYFLNEILEKFGISEFAMVSLGDLEKIFG